MSRVRFSENSSAQIEPRRMCGLVGGKLQTLAMGQPQHFDDDLG